MSSQLTHGLFPCQFLLVHLDPFTNFSNNREDLIEPGSHTNSTEMNILITLFLPKLLFNYTTSTEIARFGVGGSLRCLNEVFRPHVEDSSPDPLLNHHGWDSGNLNIPHFKISPLAPFTGGTLLAHSKSASGTT